MVDLDLTLILANYAKKADLRNRVLAPQIGYRLVDIIGAPALAGRRAPILTLGQVGYDYRRR